MLITFYQIIKDKIVFYYLCIMTEEQFMKNIKSGKDPVDTLNYWLKNLAPEIILEQRMNPQAKLDYKVRLKDCQINKPTTDEGERLLGYSISSLRKRYYGSSA